LVLLLLLLLLQVTLGYVPWLLIAPPLPPLLLLLLAFAVAWLTIIDASSCWCSQLKLMLLLFPHPHDFILLPWLTFNLQK
jgi:hypothetical protein